MLLFTVRSFIGFVFRLLGFGFRIGFLIGFVLGCLASVFTHCHSVENICRPWLSAARRAHCAM